MTHDSWKPAVEAIGEQIRPATTEQRRVATSIGLRLPDGVSRPEAAAKIRVALAEVLDEEVREPSGGQVELLTYLVGEGRVEGLLPPTKLECRAIIAVQLLERRSQVLRRLKLRKGDFVKSQRRPRGAYFEVSSIGDDGRVNFRGRGGWEWADFLEVVCRADDTSSEALRVRRQAVVYADRPQKVSLEHSLELEKFRIDEPCSEGDLAELEEILDQARDERPLQRFLEEAPQVLAVLLHGRERYVLPQQRLGAEYVADFLLADVDSSGIRWILVELETPGSSVSLKRGRDYEGHARTGLAQVREWREWLIQNLEYAKRSRHLDGLGLFGIRPKSEGLVLIGRQHNLGANADRLRRATFETEGIRVRTYDGLVDAVRGSLSFEGLPIARPFVIHEGRPD